MSYSGILLATIDASAQLPSFFELSILENLDGMIEPAVRHVFTALFTAVSSSPFSSIQTFMLDANPLFIDCLYILLKLVIEFRFLSVHSAGLAENLYKLKRITGFHDGNENPLDRPRRIISTLIIVIVPKILRMRKGYFRDSNNTRNQNSLLPKLERLISIGSSVYEAASVFQRTRYLFQQSPHYDPVSALLDITVVKSKPTENGRTQSTVATVVFAAMAIYKLTQSLRPQGAEESLLSSILKSQEIPETDSIPQPPSRKAGSLNPPQDATLCPVCLQQRRLPAVSPAGFVYCYQCILQAVRIDGMCPVSRMPCAETDIMRLLQDDFSDDTI